MPGGVRAAAAAAGQQQQQQQQLRVVEEPLWSSYGALMSFLAGRSGRCDFGREVSAVALRVCTARACATCACDLRVRVCAARARRQGGTRGCACERMGFGAMRV